MFAQSLRQQQLEWEEVEQALSHAVHLVERELHVFVDDEYPIIKFWNQYEECSWFREEEQKQQERNKLR
jgi:hypothetical protein